MLVTSVTSAQLQIGTLLPQRSLLKAINSLYYGSLLLWIAMLRRDLFSHSLSHSSAFPREQPPEWLHWSSREEIPHIQGKRNPSKRVGVARGYQKSDTLTPQSQTTSQSDHKDHSLVSLNEIKRCCVGLPKMDGSWWRDLTECGPLENGMANHFSILALRTP